MRMAGAGDTPFPSQLKSHIVRLLAICSLLGLSCTSYPAGTGGGELELYRAFPVFESEGSRRIARIELGCDPCREISIRSGIDGSDQKYFIDAESALLIENDQIISAHQEVSTDDVVVYVRLREEAVEQIRSLKVTVEDSAAAFIRRKLVGVVPLEVYESHFAIAFMSDEQLAREIVDILSP